MVYLKVFGLFCFSLCVYIGPDYYPEGLRSTLNIVHAVLCYSSVHQGIFSSSLTLYVFSFISVGLYNCRDWCKFCHFWEVWH